MTTSKEVPEKTILQRIADQLLQAQKEIDEFALQLSLSKTEAKEKFEEIKGEFRKKVGEFRRLLDEIPHKIIKPEVKQKIEELEVQLALGKAESKDEFKEQKKKLLKTMASIEGGVKEWLNANVETPSSIDHEMEKFKLKLEILRLKFSLKKFAVKDDFTEKMAGAKREIQKITDQTRTKLDKGKRKYDDFSDEIAMAYGHLRKAIKEL